MFKRVSIRYFLMLLSLPILLLGMIVGWRSFVVLERQSLILQQAYADRIEAEITDYITARTATLELLEQTNRFWDQDPRQVRSLLGRVLAHDAFFEELTVLDEVGNIWADVSRTGLNTAANDRPDALSDWDGAVFLQPSYWETEAVYISPAIYDRILRQPLVTIAIPIFERRTGRIEGVLVARTRFTMVWDLLTDIAFPEGTSAFVVSQGGRYLAHPVLSKVLSGATFDRPEVNGRQTLETGETGLVVSVPLSIGDRTAHVVVTRPLALVWSAAHQTMAAVVASAVAIWVIAALLAIALAGAVSRPIEALAASAQKIASGDLDTPIDTDGPKEISELGTAFQHMTDQLRDTIHQLEQSGHIERERALVTLEAISDAVVAMDEDGTITYLNPVAALLTGWPRGEAQATFVSTVLKLHNPDDQPIGLEAATAGLAQGHSVDLPKDTRLLDRFGTYRSVHCTLSPICGPAGNRRGIVAVFRDVTKQAALEEALRNRQKMEAVGQLTAGIAHDFNNLLAVVIGNAELIEDNGGDSARKASSIIKVSERGAVLTQRLLAFSRKQQLYTKPTDLGQVITSFADNLGQSLGSTFTVRTEIMSGLWLASVDPDRLNEALLSLGLNARDAMPSGGTITLSCQNARLKSDTSHDGMDATGEFVCLSIQDSGTGMPEDVLKQAVDPFFTTKKFGLGSGLGLSMVYGFVQQSGGKLDIDSEKGHGTTVHMYLPRAAAAAPALPADRKTAAAS